MMENIFNLMIHTIISGEIISLITFIVQVFCLLMMLRFFNVAGVFAYMSIAVVLGNIQVMKLGVFHFYPEGVALGTVTFSTLFLATDILNEYYGKLVAKRSVYLTFMAMIVGVVLMSLTLIHEPVPADAGHDAMMYLFSPSLRLFVASLIAYFSSQMMDIAIYSALKKLSPSRLIWVRAFLSLSIAAFCDNLIFSFFAWRILSPNPIPFDTLIYSYVFGGYILRLCTSILGIPVVYLAQYFIKKD